MTGEYRGCFRNGRSAVDRVITARKILGKYWGGKNVHVHHPNFDFRVAYDTMEKGNVE